MKTPNNNLKNLDLVFKIIGHLANELLSSTLKIYQLITSLQGEKMSSDDLGLLLSEIAKECVKLIDERISSDAIVRLTKMKIDPIEAILLHMKRVDRSNCVNINQEF